VRGRFTDQIIQFDRIALQHLLQSLGVPRVRDPSRDAAPTLCFFLLRPLINNHEPSALDILDRDVLAAVHVSP